MSYFAAAFEAELKRGGALNLFTWFAMNEVVHAFAGRRSLCTMVKLPKDWLRRHGNRDGAICLGCSKSLRDRATLKKLFAP